MFTERGSNVFDLKKAGIIPVGIHDTKHLRWHQNQLMGESHHWD